MFSDAHTQGIERTWREVRQNTPKYGTPSTMLLSNLCVYLFQRVYPRRERIEAFFNIMREFQENMENIPFAEGEFDPM